MFLVPIAIVRLRWLLFLLLGIIWLGGCDRLPAPSSSRSKASIPADALVEAGKGRGGYDWKFNVVPQTFLEFPHLVDWNKVKANLLPLKPDPEARYETPSKFDRDVTAAYSCLIEDTPKAEMLLELKESDEIGLKAIDMDRAGKRLATLGSKLIVWDLATGNRMLEYPSPIAKAIGLFFDPSEKYLIAHNQTEIVKIALEDGSIKERWEPTSDGIETIAVSDRADAVAVATIQGGLLVLRDGLSQIHRCSDFKLHSKRIAIHPEGRWVIASGKAGLIRWRLHEPSMPTETFQESFLKQDDAICACGKDVDRWVGPYFCSYAKYASTPEKATPIDTYVINSTIYDAHAASDGWNPDWLVILAERTNESGKEELVVQDLQDREVASTPWIVPMDNVRKIVGNQRFDRLAMTSGGVLRVYERTAWNESRGFRIGLLSRWLFRDGRLEQIELLADAVRQLGRLKNGLTGETLYEKIVREVGLEWRQCEINAPEPEVLDAIDEWYEEGGLLACLCSCRRYIDKVHVLLNERVTQAKWNNQQQLIKKHNELSLREARRAMEFEPPPASAIELLIYASRQSGVDIKSVDRYMQMYIELYPSEFSAHETLCLWLLPSVIGANANQESGKIYRVLAENFPAPFGELLYARAGIAVSNSRDWGVMNTDAGFQRTRVIDGGVKMMELGVGGPYAYEGLMKMTESPEHEKVFNDFMRYYTTHFTLPTKYAYDAELIRSLPKRQRR